MPTDFTKPWLRGKRVVPRKGDSPPRLEPVLKITKVTDDNGKPVIPKIINGAPCKIKPWIDPDDQDKHKTEKSK
jgi:hypothetical protein